MMFLVSLFKLQPFFHSSAFLYVFILVTFVTVAFPHCIYSNDDDKMSQSILFRTMHAVVIGSVGQF